MGTRSRQAGPAEELSELRRKISELVAHNAVPMVQQAIDAVREEGQYQAIKYLFEMIGLYPAVAQDDSESQESLALILLEQLGWRRFSLVNRSLIVEAKLANAIP